MPPPLPLSCLDLGSCLQLDDAALGDTLSDFLFIAGGDQVTYPVRGYQVSAINTCQESAARAAECRRSGAEASVLTDPQSISGRAVFNFSFELRASSWILSNLWFAAFSDVGAVTRRLSELSLDSFYPSIGVGARYLLYGQLPLRFDVSYPLKSTLIGEQELTYYFDFFYTF